MTTRSAPWTWGGVILSGALMVATAYAQPGLPPEEPEGVRGQQVLTQGPVHEAFAEPIDYDIQNRQTVVIPDKPPEPINEIPPDIKPEGDPQWLPGYWSWDLDEKRFIWVSGLWRNAPVGHRWVPGYWTEVEGGVTWVSGVWVPEEQEEIAYLPYPPESVESGPNIPQPQETHSWVPGCWIWFEGQWAWRPGYWVENYPNWVWVPAHHVWTPYGCIFVAGYWDFIPEDRGLLFAPVYFPPTIIHQVVYQPQICIHVDVLVQHLFVRPGFGHYYFGDYYDRQYANFGIVPWFQFHQHRRGFDPIFAHRRWRHRNDRDWVRTLERRYDERRDNRDLRPPRTFAQQRELLARVDFDRDRDRIRSIGLAENVSRLLDRRGPGDRDDFRDRTVRGEGLPKLVRLDAGERQRVTREVEQITELRQARVEIDRRSIDLRGRVGGRDATGARGDVRGRGDVDVGDRRVEGRGDADVRGPRLKLPQVDRDTTSGRPRIDLDRGGDVRIDGDRPNVTLPGRPDRGARDVDGRDAGDRRPGDADARLRPGTNPRPGPGDTRIPRTDRPETPPRTNEPGRPPRQDRGDDTPRGENPAPRVNPRGDDGPPRGVPGGNRGGGDRGNSEGSRGGDRGDSQRTVPGIGDITPRDTTPRVNDPRGNAPRIDIPREATPFDQPRGTAPRIDTPRGDRTPQQPRIDIPRGVTPRGNDQRRIDTTPRVQPRIDTTPRSRPQEQPRFDSTPRVQPRIDTTPRIQPRVDNSPRIQPRVESRPQPRPEPRINGTPRGGDAAPRIRGGDAPKVDVTPRESRPSRDADRGDRGKGKKD